MRRLLAAWIRPPWLRVCVGLTVDDPAAAAAGILIMAAGSAEALPVLFVRDVIGSVFRAS